MKSAPGRFARRFSLAALAAGALAAVALPGNRMGLGVLLTAVAVTGAALAGGAFPRTRSHAVLGLLALALAAMAVLRAAPWLIALDLMAAVALASVAAAGGRSWRGVTGGLLAAPRQLVRAPAFVVWCSGVRLSPGAARGALPATRGLALGGALVVVFGALFASADEAFAQFTERVLSPDVDLGLLPARLVTLVVIAALVASLALASVAGVREEDARPTRSRASLEWIVALSLLNLLFAAFVAVQIAVLFGGHDHVLRTSGLTYAEYAREGFFQLLVVAFLTLAVVGMAGRHRGERDGRAPTEIEALLGLLCLLAIVVVVSALRRLGLYEDAFGFTLARLLAQAATLWVGAVLLLVLAAGVLRGEWLPRAVLGAAGAALLILSLLNPEGLVAERNVDRFERTGKGDLFYLAGLGPDAAPALRRLPARKEACVLQRTAWEVREADGLFELNVGRARARGALIGLPEASPSSSTACQTPSR